MQVGIVGLGRMGTSLASRAVARGHTVSGWDPDQGARTATQRRGITTVDELASLPDTLDPPRVVLLYVPHGRPVDDTLEALLPLVGPEDVIADAGNSHWEDSRRRHQVAADSGVSFLDIGTSGGTSQAHGWDGAAFMVGGATAAFTRIRPLLEDLAVDTGAVHHVAEQPGAGHFVKLVHNAIEFGMLQSIAEGVELLHRGDYELDMPALFEHFNHGTVIRSWLIELMGHALATEPDWGSLATHVEDTGEVKWVTTWATERDIPLPAVTAAQTTLMQTRNHDWPAARALALLRHAFGEHPVRRH